MQKLSYLLAFLFSAALGFSQDNSENTLNPTSPEALAQQQLDAYNARDIEAFLAPYADSVEVYLFPNELQYKGKENMRPRYARMFKEVPDLHCKLVNRIVQKNTVIDQEEVTGFGEGKVIEAMAIYKIEKGKIAKVYFIQ